MSTEKFRQPTMISGFDGWWVTTKAKVHLTEEGRGWKKEMLEGVTAKGKKRGGERVSSAVVEGCLRKCMKRFWLKQRFLMIDAKRSGIRKHTYT